MRVVIREQCGEVVRTTELDGEVSEVIQCLLELGYLDEESDDAPVYEPCRG